MSELNNEELSVLRDMEDHRYVSDDLLKAFCSGGLSEFRKFILEKNKNIRKKHEKLAVLLRGNSDTIIVYQNNHKIWELSVDKGKNCRVSFDFNHARFSDGWEGMLDELIHDWKFCLPTPRTTTEVLPTDKRIRIKRNSRNDVIGGSIGTIKCTKKEFDKDLVKRSYEIITGFVTDFFKSQNTDLFREAVREDPTYKMQLKDVEGTGKGVLVEKRWQQRLLFHFDNMQNGYYAYDLEFSQKFPDSDYVKKYAKENGDRYAMVDAKEIKKKLGTNEPDILAIRYENAIPQSLVFIEVKSTYGACDGDAGIAKHMKGMANYGKQPIFMNNRRKDAYRSLVQYQTLGSIPEGINIEPIDNNLPIEKVVLLTNSHVPKVEGGNITPSACDYFKDNKEKIRKLADKYECDVWTTNSNYWEDDIAINMTPFN